MSDREKYVYFDIETGPLPPEKLDALRPVFEADTRLKDPLKIEADLLAKKEKFFERAALSPMTGQVLAIGLLRKDSLAGRRIIGLKEKTEAIILDEFWAEVEMSMTEVFVGFNIFGFDLPFLVKRSWANNIKVPPIRKGRYWSGRFIDLQEVWQCGEWRGEGSLDDVCRHLGFEGKPEGVSGADFARLWAEDRPTAVSYLENDLKMTRQVANRLLR